MAEVTGNGSAVTGLGGAAGFGETMLTRADDASLRVDVGAVFEDGFQFGAAHFAADELYVSTNGLVSFGGAVNGVADSLSAITRPFIAAFHADVDTRLDGEGAESGPVWVDVDPVGDVVTITWQEVGFYRRNAARTNTFQLQLFDDGAGGFTIVLRYDSIGWTTGDLEGGWQGLGGDPALIGWRLAASGAVNDHWASGIEARLLALADTAGNTGVEGLWVYHYRPPRVVNGTADNDVLSGDAGEDALYGGAGNDRLAGLAGADLLDGGAGLDLADYAQSTAGVTVNLADPGANRGLDAEGDRYVGIEGISGSAHADRLTGDGGANWLAAGAGADWLSDGAGNDTVYGGAGDDRLIAGAGADHYSGGAGSDRVDYAGAETRITLDLAAPAASTGLAAGDRFHGIEAFAGSRFGDRLAGDGTANRLYGAAGADVLLGRGGADRLFGDAGDDRLIGGSGADVLTGGAGMDVASYSTATTAIRADLAIPAANLGADALGDRYLAVEGLIGSRQNDTLAGDRQGNCLSGLAGADRLEGREGADTLSGGAGDDLLTGGAGGDLLQGGDGRDRASYAAAVAGVTADLANPTQNSGEARGDRYSGIEEVEGSAQSDRLSGNGTGNLLMGGGGNDLLQGRGGADGLYGGAGLDLASYGDAGAGVTASLGTPAMNTGDAAGDLYSLIEGLRGSAHADDLTGDALSNLLQGGGGVDRLSGGAGDDTLEGGAGADRLFGGEGVDLASYALAGSAVVARLPDPAGNAGDARGDSYDGIEGLVGSAHADTLSGGTGDDWLFGGAGADVLSGARGHDRLAGGSGDDLLNGGALADTLDGGDGLDWADYSSDIRGLTADLASPAANTGDAAGDVWLSIECLRGSFYADWLYGSEAANRLDGSAGDDQLSGRGGADELAGGAGLDTLTGGSGADSFVLRRLDEGGDLVTDYNSAEADSLDLRIAGLSRSDIGLRFQHVAGAGSAAVAEAQVFHLTTGQVLFTLQDGANLTDVFLRLGDTRYDLL